MTQRRPPQPPPEYREFLDVLAELLAARLLEMQKRPAPRGPGR